MIIYFAGAFKTSQAFGILAFITMTCAVIGVILHVFHDARDFHRFVLLAVFILFYVSGKASFKEARYTAHTFASIP